MDFKSGKDWCQIRVQVLVEKTWNSNRYSLHLSLGERLRPQILDRLVPPVLTWYSTLTTYIRTVKLRLAVQLLHRPVWTNIPHRPHVAVGNIVSGLTTYQLPVHHHCNSASRWTDWMHARRWSDNEPIMWLCLLLTGLLFWMPSSSPVRYCYL